MAKKQRPTNKRQRPISSTTTEDVDDDDQQRVGWSSIPGKRLEVDLKNKDDEQQLPSKGGKKKHPHPTSKPTKDNNTLGDDEDDEFNNLEKWTSQHYDNDSLEDDTDLYNLDDKFDVSNKYDGSMIDGSNDAGMFLSLDVIPGDAYKVEKSGDENSGFVTKVVFTDKKDEKIDGDIQKKPSVKKDKKKKGKESTVDKPAAAKDSTESKEETPALTKKERQKIKRKRKREEAKERKRLKRESGEEEEGQQSDDKKMKTASDKSNTLSAVPSKAVDRSKQNKTNKDDESTLQQITALQTSWSIQTSITLHETLATGLHKLQYTYPTPIQAATLPAAILGRRDIVGAAPTGSGKTLSYGLPILQYLLDNVSTLPSTTTQIASVVDGNKKSFAKQQPLQALILTPTRELSIQVTSELTKVSINTIKIGTIVGGFAEVKQRRTLERIRPSVIVATPGRLWELMSSKEYTHLNNLSQLRFLVVDEADRMIKQGNFPQLQQIFEVINQANPPPPENDSDEDESDSDDEEGDGYERLKSLGGVRGEARTVMLSDSILEAIERERNFGGGGSAGKKGSDAKPKPMEMDDDEYEEQQAQLLNPEEESDDEVEEESVHRQTFVYSATLTLPPSMHHLIKKDSSIKTKMKKGKGKNKQATTVDGAISEILDVAGARGEVKIVDMSNIIPEGKKSKKKSQEEDNAKKTKKGEPESSGLARRLPAGLTLGQILCAQRHKDSHLYAYLVTTRQGSSGPCLVFCNSIAAVRRVGETLKTLGLPVKMLHAQMQQKSRLGALESLRTTNSRSIVVCSDVAARGLDIASVTTVIHYDVARVVDTFIHRAGRTARGVGEKAVGTSISLVAPAEEREHQKICEAVKGSKSLEQVHIDGRLLNEAQARVALATKIVSCNDVETQVSRKNKWLQDAAREAGLDVDEDMMEDGLLDGDQRDRQRFLEAKRAKGELRQLLAKPMRVQHFGKFLSGAGLRESIKREAEVKPYIVEKTGGKRKKKNRKVIKSKPQK